ncbi:uncharacterized protein [Zea mays]|uniref:uncharacterized protein isoform X2 n=1 Tax=Zea mays TaxID=4577 RepID=UPI001651BE65|nr:uncharacterized protein LOC103650772 isoform X2 [Zea mays]
MAAATPQHDDERVFKVWPIFDEECIFDGEPIYDEDPNGLITESVDVFGSSGAPMYDDVFATSACSGVSSPSYDEDLLGVFGIFVPDCEQFDDKRTVQTRFDTAPCMESEETRQSLLVVNHFLNHTIAQALVADGADHCFGEELCFSEELDTDQTTEFQYCDGNHVGAEIRAHRTEACEGWDICQVVDHNVDAAPVADSFLALSPANKLRFDMPDGMQGGLIASNHLQGKVALDLPISKHVFDGASIDGKPCLRAHTLRSIAEEAQALEATFPIFHAQTLNVLCGTIPSYCFTIALIAVDGHFNL